MKKMQDTASPGHFVCRRMLILKTFLVILLWSTCLVSGYRGHAQERTTVTVNMTDVTLNEVITELKKQTKYDFFYNSELVKSKGRVSVRARNLDLREVLEQVLTPVGLEYAIQQDLITIRERRVQQEVAKIEMITVSGKVTDKDGNPVVGATVVIHGTTQGVATDVDGKYSLMTRPDDVLTISFIGYKTEVVPVKENKHLNVILSPASEDLEEVTVVAFGQQKKESVVSAITTVRPMDLKSSNSDLTSSFAGKIAGMVGWQTGGLPAALTEDEMNTKFYYVVSDRGECGPLDFVGWRRIVEAGFGTYSSGRYRNIQCDEGCFGYGDVRCTWCERSDFGDDEKRTGGECVCDSTLRDGVFNADKAYRCGGSGGLYENV